MNTLYGFSVDLKGYPWYDLAEEFEQDGIKFKVAMGRMEIGFEKEEEVEKAKMLAQTYINAQSLRTGQKIHLEFNHSWQPNASGGKHHSLTLSEEVKVSDRVQIGRQTHQVTITGMVSIANQQIHDSASFINDKIMVEKALKDSTLEQALGYYSQEVVEDDKPLYGIYKALEVITNQLGKGKETEGRKLLAQLAGKPHSFVDDVMQTTQPQRHAITLAIRKITDEECKERAKVLIQTYADTI